jgi:uncharacterized membrane protein
VTGSGLPPATPYQRWMGWHALSLRRALVAVTIGLIVALSLLRFVNPVLAVVAGWDTAASTFLATVWPIIVRADSSRARYLSAREDETRATATVLLVSASVASLLGAGYSLVVAGRQAGSHRLLLIGLALLTVTLSWTVINTVYTLRYAHLHFASKDAGIEFGDSASKGRPDYRDFAYVAFTIGMCYQVSDNTLRDRRIRRTVLSHALLAYLFGVVIVSGSVSLVTGLVR